MKKSNAGGKRAGAGRPKGEATKALGLRVPVKYHKEIVVLIRKELDRLRKKNLKK